MTSAATRILRARGHFEVLGLPREQCTSAAVRAQFTKLVKEVHPDKCSHPDAAAAFRRLQAANDALKATGSRTRHLLREQRRPPDRPSAVAPVLETIGSTRVLAAAAGCLVLAEVCRIAFGEEAVAVEPVASPRAAGARADARAARARVLVDGRAALRGPLERSHRRQGRRRAGESRGAAARLAGSRSRPWPRGRTCGGRRRWPGRSVRPLC